MIGSSGRPEHRRRKREASRAAIIDIGSNTVRLVVYGSPKRAPTVLWNEKVSARLGRDLAETGAIPDEAMEEALEALARYALILDDLGITDVEPVATAAAREASNGSAFLDQVRARGIDVRLLSGEEEAVASAHGAIGAFPEAHGVVADLGGGSLELVAVREGACQNGASFPLGTLRLPALRAKGNFERKVAKMLKGEDWAHAHDGPLYMIGGTWRALAAYAMRAMDYPLTDPHGFTLTVEEALAFAKTIQRSKTSKLAQIQGISSMRAERLPDAAALLRVLLKELEPEGLVFSSWGLREGLLFQRIDPLDRGKDPLLAGVSAFAEERSATVTDATLLAAWTSAAARRAGTHNERLRLATAQLALALQRVEPNLRREHALEWALDKRWIGLDAKGRAMLGAALLGALGTTDLPERLTRIAQDRELREATGWGLAIRLAQRLGAGARAALSASRLKLEDDILTLRIDPDHAALVTQSVKKDLSTLAEWLDASTAIE